MGDTSNRLAGTAHVSVNGMSIMVAADFKYSPSTVTRETLTGMDFVHGYKESRLPVLSRCASVIPAVPPWRILTA